MHIISLYRRPNKRNDGRHSYDGHRTGLPLLGRARAHHGQIIPVSLGLQVILGHKTQRRGIDTIPIPPIRPIGKNMPQMRIGGYGSDLSAPHPMGGIGFFDNGFRIHRLRKTGPPRAGIKFVDRCKKNLPRNHIHIQALPLMIPIGIVKGRLGAVFFGDIMLEGGEGHRGRVCRNFPLFMDDRLSPMRRFQRGLP